MIEKINILGTDYKIRPITVEERRERDGQLGFFSPGAQVIALAEDLPPSSLADTFLHEVFHCIAWMLQIRRQMDNSKSNIDLEEVLVGQVSSALQQVVRANPEAFEWYQGLIK